MFERYTEHARRSIFFARYEASVAGSSHIETTHLLLGLLREDRTLAALVSDLESLRAELIPEPAKPQASSLDLPLSHESKRALAFGAEEAQQAGHYTITCAHLVLGILRVGESAAAHALGARSVVPQKVRDLIGQDTGPKPAADRSILHALVDRLPDTALAKTTDLLRQVEALKPPTGSLSAHAAGGWNAGPAFEPSDGCFSSSHKEPDGATVVETRHLVRGHEILVTERLKLSEDGKMLAYSHEVRGPGQQRQRHEFDFDVRPN